MDRKREEGTLSKARACSQCGSVATEDTTRFCGYCGSELPEKAAPVVVGPFGDLDARFEALEKAPPPRGPGRRRVRAAVVQTSRGFQILFGIVFAVVGGGIGFGAVGMGAPWFFALIPFVFVCVGIGIALHGGSETVRFARAKLRRIPALVADERTHVTGGEHTRTHYFITLQTRSGGRREYRADSKFAGELTEGDMGFAYVRAGYLLDFARVDV